MGDVLRPDFTKYSSLKPFRFWCQKVLPAVYDDSLSYYELLNKVIAYLNEMVNNEEALISNFEKLAQYVDEYFDNLDVQEEIDNKLDEMAEMGELDRYVNPYQLKGKKIVFFGDSLTYGYNGDGNNGRVDEPYPTIIANLSGATIVNAGVSGATLASKVSESGQNDLARQLSVTNYTDADYIILEFGTNDFVQGIPIGCEVDNATGWGTFNDALFMALTTIRQNNNKAEIIFLGSPAGVRYYNQNNNVWGCNFKAYDEAIRNFCRKHSLIYIDLIKHMGFDENYTQFTVDGTHYTQEGYNKLALCVLRNFGGNSTLNPYFENAWEDMQIPCRDKIGRYDVVTEGNASTQLTYNPVTIKAGSYRIEFDAKCTAGSYSYEDGYVGVHIRIGGGAFCSPIGFKTDGNLHHYIVYKTVVEDLTGNLALRPATNISGFTFTDMYVENFKITPLKGEVILNNVVDLEIVNGSSSSFVKVERAKGKITVNVDFTPTATISAFTSLVTQSNALKKVYNLTEEHYNPACITPTTFSRLGILNTVISLASQLTSSNRVLYTGTY